MTLGLLSYYKNRHVPNAYNTALYEDDSLHSFTHMPNQPGLLLTNSYHPVKSKDKIEAQNNQGIYRSPDLEFGVVVLRGLLDEVQVVTTTSLVDIISLSGPARWRIVLLLYRSPYPDSGNKAIISSSELTALLPGIIWSCFSCHF